MLASGAAAGLAAQRQRHAAEPGRGGRAAAGCAAASGTGAAGCRTRGGWGGAALGSAGGARMWEAHAGRDAAAAAPRVPSFPLPLRVCHCHVSLCSAHVPFPALRVASPQAASRAQELLAGLRRGAGEYLVAVRGAGDFIGEMEVLGEPCCYCFVFVRGHVGQAYRCVSMLRCHFVVAGCPSRVWESLWPFSLPRRRQPQPAGGQRGCVQCRGRAGRRHPLPRSQSLPGQGPAGALGMLCSLWSCSTASLPLLPHRHRHTCQLRPARRPSSSWRS